MERLAGVPDGEPVYRVEATLWHDRLGPLVQLGFSDVAAHPFERLVEGTVAVLAAVPGVRAVWQEDREVVLVSAPGVPLEVLTDVVDRYWLHMLPRTTVDRDVFGDDVPLRLPPGAPDVVLPPSAPIPPPPPGAVLVAPPEPVLAGLRDAVRLPPSRRRFWTYLVCGLVPLSAGVVMATHPGGADGVLPLALGAVNVAVAARIGWRRRREE